LIGLVQNVLKIIKVNVVS